MVSRDSEAEHRKSGEGDPVRVRAHELLVDAAISHAQSTAIHWVDRDRSLTYADAVGAMNRAASVLAEFGVGAGGRVGVFAHPGLDYVVALLGTWRLGATPVLVDLSAGERFGELMALAAPDAVVYTNDHFEYVQPAMPRLPSTTMYAGMDGPQKGAVGWLESLTEADDTGVVADGGSADDLAHVVFPNNETPVSQACHAELVSAARSFASRLALSSDDVTMCPTPLAERFHLESSILAAFSCGATAGMLKSWTAESGWQAMDDNGSTVLCGAPPHMADLLTVSASKGRPPAGLRIAVTQPGPDVAELTERFRVDLGLELVT